MILTGGFVAGTRAGFAFNDWPFMNGHVVPPSLFALDPWWVNPFENLATVQFDHRLVAYLLCLVIPVYWWRARRHALGRGTRMLFHLLLAMLALQVTLGIATLMHFVPVPLAAAHQAGALLLFTLALVVNHRLRTGRVSTDSNQPR
jgi:cytochrome c oxidase assembly protein subunit 15